MILAIVPFRIFLVLTNFSHFQKYRKKVEVGAAKKEYEQYVKELGDLPLLIGKPRKNIHLLDQIIYFYMTGSIRIILLSNLYGGFMRGKVIYSWLSSESLTSADILWYQLFLAGYIFIGIIRTVGVLIIYPVSWKEYKLAREMRWRVYKELEEEAQKELEKKNSTDKASPPIKNKR